MIDACELVLAAAANLGEGALWDTRTNSLLWVDIVERRVAQFDPATRQNRVWQLETMVGAVVPTTDDDLMVAVHEGFARLNRETGCLSELQTPANHDPATLRFNDGKCDPAGRFIAGTMSLSQQRGSAALYALHPDGRLRRLLTGVTVSNGLAWSLDGSRLYYIDTPRRTIDAFDYDLAAGTIRNRRTAIEIPSELGYPDGMTRDADGMLWVAMWDGGAVTRWNPNSGRLLQSLALPVSRVTSCAFGGPNLATLFVTSARRGLTPAELRRQPLAGGIFALHPAASGIPADEFGGQRGE